jgi:tRNA (guanine26-N2/guanine27-N2)-dimethyltransferase
MPGGLGGEATAGHRTPLDSDGILEGATRLFPPANNLGKPARAPGTKATGVPFYNPGMALNRDLSVLLVEAHAKAAGREIDVLDALAGTGARSIRLAHEVQAPLIVHANDGDASAVAAVRKGAAANLVSESRLQVSEGDAHVRMASRRFDVIDLDPYGSPMPFVDAAMRAVRHGGLVCATATDTGALAGAFPKACRRRYDAHHGLHRPPWRSEVGLRILAGALVRSAARFDRAAIPVLSVSHGHWMRVVARVGDSKKGGDAALRGLGDAWLDPNGFGQVGPRAPHEAGTAWAGPLWTGPLHDATLVDGMQEAMTGKSLARGDEVRALLGLLRAECEAPPFWIVPDRFQRSLGPPPRRDALIDRLTKAGFTAARTHLDAQGVRTNAGLDGLRAAWKT